MKIDDIQKLLEQSTSHFIVGPLVIKVIKDNYGDDKTALIGDETGTVKLHQQAATNPLIRAGAVIRLFSIYVESHCLHFRKTSLVDPALKIAKREVLDLKAELDPWFTVEALKKCEPNETLVNVPILVMVHSVGSVKKFSMGRSLQTVLVSDGTTKFEIKMWNEAIEKFSHQFEKVTGQWILLSKYTVDSFRGCLGVKLYNTSSIELVNQNDERVLAQKSKLTQEHMTELDDVRGNAITGQILFFPEDSFYQYSKCLDCKMTASIKDKMADSCTIGGCSGKLKSCFKVDVQFLKSETSEVVQLTGFDQVFSLYDRKGGPKPGQSLDIRFKKLVGKPLTLLYKTSFKRSSDGEPSLIIDDIKLMDPPQQ